MKNKQKEWHTATKPIYLIAMSLIQLSKQLTVQYFMLYRIRIARNIVHVNANQMQMQMK